MKKGEKGRERCTYSMTQSWNLRMKPSFPKGCFDRERGEVDSCPSKKWIFLKKGVLPLEKMADDCRHFPVPFLSLYIFEEQ